MSIVRQGPSVLSKLQSGGGENFAIPGAWSQTAYGSGWPVAPVSAPKDVEIPRSIDYPISVNSMITPRTGYGLMPFSALLAAYENVTEVKAPVSLIHRELNGFIPHLVDNNGNSVEDHPYLWMTQYPDRKTPFGVWLTRFLKSSKVYDAPAVYLHKNGNQIDALHYIDGSTLFIILDQFGNIPEPEPIEEYVRREMVTSQPRVQIPTPQGAAKGAGSLTEWAAQYSKRLRDGQPVPEKVPAYSQVIKGTPFSWWDASEIWYMPQSRRLNAPYGESFIESAWSWIMIIVNVTAFELGHYRTGNMPEGFVTMPNSAAANIDALMGLEMAYNQRMAGNPTTERNRLRFFPDGAKYFPTKKPDFPRDLYTQAWHNILNAIGVQPSAFGETPGTGLGGKGFKEGAANDFGRQTLNPHREFVASLFNEVLERDGVTDVKFSLDYNIEEIDPDKQKQSVYEGMAHGTLTLNDALGQLNLQAVGDPNDRENIANKHLIVAGATIYVVEDLQTQNGMAIPTLGAGQQNQTGGVPVGAETAVEQQGAEHNPTEERKTIEKLLRNLQDTGTLDGKFYSVPGELAVKYDNPFDELDAWMGKVLHWGALRKFTVRSLPLHISDFIRAELDLMGAKASKRLRKDVFIDAAYVMGRNTLRKDYETIASAFQDDVGGLIDDSQDDDPISQQAFGSRYRSALRRHGLQMFRQGMVDNGVDPESLSAEQLKVFRDWQADVSGHVGNLRRQAYSEDGLTNPDARPDWWTNVSLRDVYYRGATTVAPDALKIWQVGATEHCATCLSRDGQVKTLSEWGDVGYPGSFSDLDCRGVNCQCELVDLPPEEDNTEKFDANQLRHTSGKWIKDGATGLYVREAQRKSAELNDTVQQHLDSQKHTQAEADYTPTAADPAHRCALCKHYLAGGTCQVVRGTISPDGWCTYFQANSE